MTDDKVKKKEICLLKDDLLTLNKSNFKKRITRDLRKRWKNNITAKKSREKGKARLGKV